MRSQDDHSKEKLPLRLNEEEKKDFFAVVDDFFSCFHLHEVEEMLWDWLMVAITSDNDTYDSGTERSNLIFFWQKLEGIVQATHVIQQKKTQKKKKKKNKTTKKS